MLQRGRNTHDPPPSSPVTAARVGERIDVLESGEQPPMPVAPLSAAERLATLEEQQRTTRGILAEHTRIHSDLANALSALVTRFEKMERKLIYAAVILFAGTSNGTKIFEAAARLLS